MKYFKINYSVLRDYIYKRKEEYNLVDIIFLLENSFINQQQFEDLATIIHDPTYTYDDFYHVDKGYYHQQGPLSLTQNYHQVLASLKTEKRVNSIRQRLIKDLKMR